MQIQKRKEILDFLSSKLKRKKYISLLLALFTFGVNIFAWIVFTTTVGLDLNVDVASWDVIISEDDNVIDKNLVVSITNMRPGMEEFEKEISIHNSGDTSASVLFDLVSVSLLGREYDLRDENAMNVFNSYFPFDLSLAATSDSIDKNDTSIFKINLKWDWEDDSEDTVYYSQDRFYAYNKILDYYSKNDSNSYFSNNMITNSFDFEANKSNLYLNKDDADSYFGIECSNYEKENEAACLKLSIKLKVEQKK